MQIRKPFIIIFIVGIGFISLILSACAYQSAKPLVTETYELQDFSGLVIHGIGQVTITNGEVNSLTIVAEPAIIKNITHSIAEDTLYLDMTDDMSLASLDPRLSIQFLITAREVKSIQNFGSCSITGSDLSGKTLQIFQDAVGDITLSNLNYETVEVNLAGGGTVEVNGSIDEQIINMDGAVRFSSSETPSKIINAHLTGNSQAVVWVTDLLNVDTAENALFQFYGLPHDTYLGLIPENVHALGQK